MSPSLRSLTLPSASVVLATILTAPSTAQAVVAEESFDFGSAGTLLGGNGSGTGWLNPWDAGPGNNYGSLVSPGFDAIGHRVHLNGAAVPCFRDLDVTQHPDLVDAGRYGADEATIWVRFQAQDVSATSFDPYFGGLSLFDGVVEELFIGVPWGTQLWGIDDHNGGLHTVAGTDDDLQTTIVVRIDYMIGDERVRLWVDPAVSHPTTAADVDILVPDFRFDRIRIDNGGSGLGANARFDFDAIRLEKEVGSPGTNYCTANPNSTGGTASIFATGSAVVSANNLTLNCDGMPNQAFGFFLTSTTQANVPGAGGSAGVLCVGGSIGRYVGPGQVQSSGSTGSVSLPVDLTQHPMPTGLINVQPGQTWNFTRWFRDTSGGMPTSNFSDGLEIAFV